MRNRPSGYFSRSGDASSGRLTALELLGVKPQSQALPNKAGITDALAVVRYEAMVTAVTIPFAINRLRSNSQTWGLKQWRMTHRIIFQPVYDWAGQIRTTNISKQDRVFADKDTIEQKVKAIFASLYTMHAVRGDLAAGLGSLRTDDFCSVFANLYNQLNLVHPFREGNGRSLKTLLTAIARQSGRDFRWNSLAAKSWEFDPACIAAANGDSTKLTNLFKEITEWHNPQTPQMVPRRIKKRHQKTFVIEGA